FMGTCDGRGDAAAWREGADDATAHRPAGGHEIVEQAIDQGLVEDALVAVALQVELERFQFDAALGGRVGEGDGAEIRLPRLRTDAGEFRTDNFDAVIPAGKRVGKRLQLVGRGDLDRGHALFLVGRLAGSSYQGFQVLNWVHF